MKKTVTKPQGSVGGRRAGPAKPAAPAKSKWQKSSPQLVELFGRIQDMLPPDAEKRKMFGYPCSFVRGQMFAGLHQDNMVLRLSDPDRAAFLTMRGAEVFSPMPGRVMKEYVVVPPSLKRDEGALLQWAVKAFSYARSLGPKAKK